MPESPLKDMRKRAEELSTLIDMAEQEAPDGVTRIGCESWLNELAPFLELFPPEWPRPDKVSTLTYGFNWWGQFAARDGGFHQKHGDIMRTTTTFPFKSILGLCEIDALKRRLK